MKTRTPDQRRKALQKFMRERGLKMLPWAEKAGVSEGAIRNFLKGKSDSLSQRTLEALASAEGVAISELMGGTTKGPIPVPVLNYVGAGGLVYPIDDYAQGGGMDEVYAPDGVDPEGLVALRVKGDSMRPLKDGYVLFYTRSQDGVPEDCLNQLCVVCLEDQRVMVKEVRKGYSPARFNLISWNADPIEDVGIVWAARVLWIKPG